MLINDLTSAFRQGKALTNSATWANTATATGALSAVLVGGFTSLRRLAMTLGLMMHNSHRLPVVSLLFVLICY